MLYCLQHFIRCWLRERSREGEERKKTNMLCYLQTRSTDCEGFLLKKPDLQPVALGWKSEGGACGGGREGGLSQKTFLIAFGLKRIS